MTIQPNYPQTIALIFLLSLGQAACNSGAPRSKEAAPASVDATAQPASADTMAAPAPGTSVASLPITPSSSETARDTPPAEAPKPKRQAEGTGGMKVGQVEYEGWRQYSVNCARCHGQDALPNPVAANLLVSLGPKGPIDTPEKFFQVVSEGRPERGMPGFKNLLAPEQINAMYAYVKGRADGRIQAGRPVKPQT